MAGYPLSPIFALLNNIFEIRGDASKMLWFHRRPVNRPAIGIGVWLKIIDTIGKFSVLTNVIYFNMFYCIQIYYILPSQGLIIAFTADFIPNLVYRFSVSPNYSLNGILNNTLSIFAVADFEPGTAPIETKYPGLTHCYYKALREPAGTPNEYELLPYHTKVMLFRFVFVVLWENTISLVTIMIKWFLGPMSTAVRDRIEREKYITNEIFVMHERKRGACM